MNAIYDILKTPLSPAELEGLARKFGLNIDVVFYDDIIRMNDIEQLLNRGTDGVIIFYPNSKEGNLVNGHYVSLFENNGIIYFYDSYSDKPDAVKLQTAQRNELYQENINSLINLLYQSPYKVDYNHFKHQKIINDSSTCGRHGLMRLLHRHLNTEQYNQEIKRLCNKFKLDPDELVSVAIN